MCDEPCSYDAVFVIRYAGSIDTRHLAPVSQDTGPVQVAVVSRSRARSGDKAYMVFGIPSCVRWRCCAYFLENLRPSNAHRHVNAKLTLLQQHSRSVPMIQASDYTATDGC